MNRARSTNLGWTVIAVGVVVACGSPSRDSLYGDPGPGSGGAGGSISGSGGTAPGTGGAPNSGGASASGGKGNGGTVPSSGGRANTGGNPTGGAPAMGGTPNTGGTTPEGGVPECASPSAKDKAALCFVFDPERIRARSDAKLDKRGRLIVQLFDTDLPYGDEKAHLLAEQTYPDNDSEVSVDELPMMRFEETLPATVYARAVFVDNPDALVDGGPGYGIWVGGADFSRGVVAQQPLGAIDVTPGDALSLPTQLTAFRRLDVKVTLATNPLGDGQGPLLVTVVRPQDPNATTPFFGYAGEACTDVTQGVETTGFIVGSGTYYVAALLNDLGGKALVPPGAVISLDGSSTVQAPRLRTRLTVGAQEYAVSADVELNTVIPTTDGIGPNSCADIPH